MADYTFVGSTVRQVTGSPKNYIAGEELEAGNFVYFDPTSGKVFKADNTSELNAAVVGITLAYAFTDQPVPVGLDGEIYTSTSLSYAGKTFILSNVTPGKMADAADVPGLGKYYTLIGYSVAANNFALLVTPSGVTR